MDQGYISERLAEFAIDTGYEDIPAPVSDKMKKHILDTLGAGIAGALSDETQKLAKVFESVESQGNIPLWGTGRFAGARNAALGNGLSCHTFELDDTGGCDHSGAVVIPAIFAAMGLCNHNVSGKDIITASVIGYDIARRALESCGAYEPHNEAGWHSTSTCGTFGAAVAAGRLLGLNKEQMVWALGLAASMSCGLWGFIHDGAQSKKLHPGRAAEGGLLAALLAKENFRGPKMIFDDVWGGFNTTFSPTSKDSDGWLRELGSNWKINRVSIKPYASCRSTHSSIDGVDIIMKELKAEKTDIATVEVRMSPFINGMCGGCDMSKLSSSQMSIPYGIAARIVYGSAGLSSYTEDKRHNNEITQVLSNIKIIVDEKMGSDEEPIVRLSLKNGESREMCVKIPLGSPDNPVTLDDLLSKYRNVGLMVWNESIVDELSDKVLMLEDVADGKLLNELLGSKPVHNTGVVLK